jgi:hypothetical protein
LLYLFFFFFFFWFCLVVKIIKTQPIFLDKKVWRSLLLVLWRSLKFCGRFLVLELLVLVLLQHDDGGGDDEEMKISPNFLFFTSGWTCGAPMLVGGEIQQVSCC